MFGCPVADEYSSEELSRIAFQCPKKQYHLQEDCSYIEIMNPEKDLGSIRNSNCSCGIKGRILENIAGRRNSSFRLPSGKIIPSGKILDWTYSLFLDLNLDILQFQVIQESFFKIKIIIVPGNSYKPEVNDKQIANSFKKMFGSFITVQVERVISIPKTKAGKHIPIKSEINQNLKS